MKTTTLLLTASLALNSCPAPAADACDAQTPPALKAQVAKKYPGFRTPLVTDNLAEDVAWDIRQSGSGCIGVARADFDGDEKPDFLLGLSELDGDGAKVVVALTRCGSWRVHELSEWPTSRNRLYVDKAKPGTFDRTQSLEGPMEDGEVSHMTCPNSVAIFGATESTGVAYCFNNGTWTHTWISD